MIVRRRLFHHGRSLSVYFNAVQGLQRPKPVPEADEADDSSVGGPSVEYLSDLPG